MLPELATTCHQQHGNTNVPLCIIIKSTYSDMPFVSTCYTENSLEYSSIKILYTNNSELTNETFLGKKPPIATCRGSWVVTLGQWCQHTH